MTLVDLLLERNGHYVETDFPGARPLRPARGLAIVACMDSRMDMFELLGLDNGDAHVIRNAGGVVTDDVIRSLAISQRVLGTHGIVLVHHTDCGLQKINDDAFRDELEQATGLRPTFSIESFRDARASVRQSIARLQHSPFIVSTEIVGFVYDVESGRLEVVEES